MDGSEEEAYMAYEKKMEPMKISMGSTQSCSPCGASGCEHCHGFGKKVLLTLKGVLIAYLIFFIGTLIHNSIRKYSYIGMAPQNERTITINGVGKATGNNDIAVTSLGFENTDKDVSKAQADNKKVMDPLLAELKKLGVEDKDLQTNYSITPDYNYTQTGGRDLLGYKVSNTVTIKIRDLSKIPTVLNMPGKYGANSVGGLSFTIDEPEDLKQQARDKAIADAQTRALRLAYTLGVKLAGVVAFNEYSEPVYQRIMYESAAMKVDGTGGADMVAPEAVASGSQQVVVNVNVTYKIVELTRARW